MTVLRIELLDNGRLTYGGEAVVGLGSARLQSLLAYLILYSHRPEQRRHLAFLFWPDSSESQARTNLRRELHHLRQLLPDADRFIAVDSNTLQWRGDAPFALDVTTFENFVAEAEQALKSGEQNLARQAFEEAVRLYRSDLLPSCYDEWILPERERLRQSCTAALEQLVGLLEAQREYPQAIRYAQRLLQLDPLHEASYRCLMRLHAVKGDRAGALRVYHSCATILQRELGVAPSPATREVYDRLVATGKQTALHTESPPALAASLPLVGRRQEWGTLLGAWRRAAEGHAHLVAVSGEAGIGKTRLAEELLEWAAQQGVSVARTRSYAAEGRLAYAPVTEWLRSPMLVSSLSRLEPVWLSEVSRLLPELLVAHPDLPRPEPLGESWQHQRFFEALARAVLAANQPLLLVIDDLQWCDRETLAWLHYLLRFAPGAKLLIVGTIRSEELADNEALRSLLLDLQTLGQLTEITLGPLDYAETSDLAVRTVGHELDDAVEARLFQEAEGHPLFVVEMVRAGLAVGPRGKGEGHRSGAALPPKVQAVIGARLNQLSPQARDLAHLAATIGRAFSVEVLGEAGDLDEDELVHALDELWQRRIVREGDAEAYDFSHDRIREVAYVEMSPVRRRLLHRRVAQALELLHAGNPDSVSAQLAAHYEWAGQVAKAVHYYERAAEAARRVYANAEAIRFLSRALDLLEQRPDSLERDRLELRLQLALAVLLRISRGYADQAVKDVLDRSRRLCRRTDERKQLGHVLLGLFSCFFVRGEVGRLHDIDTQMLVLAEELREPASLIEVHFVLAGTRFCLGEPAQALEHYERAMALYDARQHGAHVGVFGSDLGVFCMAWGAHVLWLLGYPEQALERSRAAVKLADELAHPFSRALAASYRAMLHQFRGEADETRHCAEVASAVCREYGFSYYLSWAAILRAWTRADDPKGIARLHSAITDFRADGSGARLPYYLTLLAEKLTEAGQPEAGLELLGRARAISQERDDRWWEAELHRRRGELLAAQGVDRGKVESCFRQALALARRQQAKSLELRAAMSLSRLWRDRGKRDEAYELLAGVYGWFTEGFDSRDLNEAKRLLEDLT